MRPAGRSNDEEPAAPRWERVGVVSGWEERVVEESVVEESVVERSVAAAAAALGAAVESDMMTRIHLWVAME